MTIDTPIIFLDIDGCLTSVEDGSSFLCMEPDIYRLSESRLELLIALLAASGAKVVISSNWRRFEDDGCWKVSPGLIFRNQLPKLRKLLGDRYAGDLPTDPYINKSEALLLWAEEHGIDLSEIRYVIIDDDPREGFLHSPIFKSHYIHCNPDTGITKQQCQEALNILKGHDNGTYA